MMVSVFKVAVVLLPTMLLIVACTGTSASEQKIASPRRLRRYDSAPLVVGRETGKKGALEVGTSLDILRHEMMFFRDPEMQSFSMRMSFCYGDHVDFDETDVGTPEISGKTKREGPNGFDLTGGGRSKTVVYTSFGLTDDFHFAYKQLSGSFRIIARMTIVGNLSDFIGRAGIMIRESLDAGAKNVFAHSVYSTDLDIFTQVARSDRTASQGTTTLRILDNTGSDSVWFRLDRSGDDVVPYYALDLGPGACPGRWIEMSSQNPTRIASPSPMFAGLAVSSQNDNQVEKAHFDNVVIVPLVVG